MKNNKTQYIKGSQSYPTAKKRSLPPPSDTQKGQAFRPYHYPEELNFPLEKYYEPGFMDPLYAQYIRKPCQELEVKATPLFRPELVRRGRGQAFQRLFASDPCPEGWTKYESMTPEDQNRVKQYSESDPQSFCFPSIPEFEPVLYSDKFKYYGNTIMFGPKYQDLNAARPVNEYKDYAYLTQRPSGYVAGGCGVNFLYQP
jgi:hypothetical protein